MIGMIGIAQEGAVPMKRLIFLTSLLLTLQTARASIYSIVLGRLVGYTILAATTAKGQFNGNLHDHLVTLENGWVFRIKEYTFVYASDPDVVVLAKNFTPDDLRKMGIATTVSFTVWKLIFDNEVLDAERVTFRN
jgi:hypothetical protein